MAKYLKVEEAADRLQIHPETLYRLLREGRAPGFRIGGQWRIDEDQLAAYARGEWKPTVEPKNGAAA